MKARNLFTASCLALALTNTLPVYAYSNAKLDKFEEELQDYISEEIENQTYEYFNYEYANEEDRDFLESLNFGIRIQTLIKYIPLEYYYTLVDNIKTAPLIKKVLKACIDENMCDVAKEAIVCANIIENEQEILDKIMCFFESRYNGNAYEAGRVKDNYNLEDISVFDNREKLIDIPNSIIIFRDYSLYENYCIFEYHDFSSYYGDVYYLITDDENKILAYIKRVDEKNSYEYVGDENVYIDSLESYLHQVDLEGEVKTSYTYEELRKLPCHIIESETRDKNNPQKNPSKRRIFRLDQKFITML